MRRNGLVHSTEKTWTLLISQIASSKLLGSIKYSLQVAATFPQLCCQIYMSRNGRENMLALRNAFPDFRPRRAAALTHLLQTGIFTTEGDICNANSCRSSMLGSDGNAAH